MALSETNDICEIVICKIISPYETSAEIGLVQEDDGTRAALMREDEIAFETAGVVVAVESTDDEQEVHVRGEDLLAQALARLLAGELGAPGQHFGDDASLSQDDPVADAWRIVIEVAEMAANGGGDFAGSCPDDVVIAVH
jgi:hypothetical protein